MPSGQGGIPDTVVTEEAISVALTAVTPDERVGIFACGQDRDVHVESCADQHFTGFRSRSLTRGVRIEAQDDLAREPAQLLDLLRGQGRTARRDDRLVAGLEKLGEVEVALDEDGEATLADGGLGQVQPIQRPALRVDRRFWRVQVFRWLVGVERPTRRTR